MVITLAMDPTRTSTLYAGTSGGVYKSVDQAGHWKQVNNGLVPGDMVKTSRALNVTAILVNPYRPETVYAATLAGLYKTTDEAKSWKRIGESLQDQMIISMILDRTREDRLYIVGRGGVLRSEDGGTSWKTINTGFTATNVRTIAQSASDANLFYAGTNGSGLYRSTDAGDTWHPMPPLRPAN